MRPTPFSPDGCGFCQTLNADVETVGPRNVCADRCQLLDGEDLLDDPIEDLRQQDEIAAYFAAIDDPF